MHNFSFKKQVLTGFFATLVFAFVLAIISYLSIRSLQHDAEKVYDSEWVIKKTDQVLQSIVQAEISHRQYLLSGQPAYHESYNYAVNKILPEVQELKESVIKNSSQLNRADTLNYYVVQKLSEMQKIMDVNAQKHDVASRMLINTMGGGSNLMDKVRQVANEIKTIENDTIKRARLESSSTIRWELLIIIFGAFIVVLLVLLMLSYILRTFKRQKLVEEEVRSTNSALAQISEEHKNENWVLEGAVVIDIAMRGAQTLDERCISLITEASKYVKADLGAIYIADSSGEFLKIEASYAFPKESSKNVLKSEVGLIGQAVVQKKGVIFNNVPKNYIKVSSGLGESLPQTIFIQPIFVQDQLVAVIELAFANDIILNTDKLFDKVAYSVGISVQAAQARVSMQNLIKRTQQQAEELESQHEELRTTNDELVHKTHALQASEEELRVQQEELRQINSELEEKAELLEDQNKTIDQARRDIVLKAQELERTSKYKSEFLANMSHELRTPLNSILILARILKENKNINLSEDQVKYATVIYNAGNDLLTLINDILDLAKIESGKIDLNIEEVSINEIKRDMEMLFTEVANNKKIDFVFNIASDVPENLVSDRLRLEQILKNLLSNAFKFTPKKGKITVNAGLAESDRRFSSENLQASDGKSVITFTVKDTGIGIENDKLKTIFEAFQQADGSTSRKYGGTGLGLSISRELAHILGGEIDVESAPGEGSSFVLYVPLSYNEDQVIKTEPEVASVNEADAVKDSSNVFNNIKLHEDKENTILIIEDDINFAEILKDYALERGFKPILAYQGDTGLDMALEYLPNAIILDIMLPVMDGWSVLKRLKEDKRTKDIPVHLMSAEDERPVKARKEGAIGFMKKPTDKEKLDEAFDLLITRGQFKLNKVLIIEDHKIQSEDLRNQLIKNDVVVRQSFDGAEALDILQKEQDFDCIILDLNLPDISGLDLLDKIKSDETLYEIPVVINTAMELDQDSIARVMKYTHAMVLKNKKSNDRLMDEVNLFMNKIKTDREKPSSRGFTSSSVKNTITYEKVLKNKSVLIVDDDMRNIFALTSALQAYDLQVEIANNGVEALKKINDNPGLDIVLMDIMMPEMDGYEAMREIRKQNRFNKLPIIALTAKAMKNDREKCIEAGANDYISKPVDIDKLLSLIRVWLS